MKDESNNRRTMLKMAMLGGGAALAGLMRNSAQAADPSPKEQQAQGAIDKATRGMPAPRSGISAPSGSAAVASTTP